MRSEIARGSSLQFKGKHADSREVGKALGVLYLSQNRPDRAEAMFRKALEFLPRYQALLNDLRLLPDDVADDGRIPASTG